MRSRLAAPIALVLLLVAASALADVEIVLRNDWINTYADRATIATDFTIAFAHASPKAPKDDGDIHIAGWDENAIGLATVAEIINARRSLAGVKVANDNQGGVGGGPPVQLDGVWRLWCEHGGDYAFVQGNALDEYPHTNPDHVFEIHPVTQIGRVPTLDTFRPVSGYAYKDAAQAFTVYENVSCEIEPGPETTTIRTKMAGYNYVHFRLHLREKPQHRTADGHVTVFGTAEEISGEDLVRHLRFVLIRDTPPFDAIMALDSDDTVKVIGMPRINLALVRYRVREGLWISQPNALDPFGSGQSVAEWVTADERGKLKARMGGIEPSPDQLADALDERRTRHADILNWTVPYEIVIVGLK